MNSENHKNFNDFSKLSMTLHFNLRFNIIKNLIETMNF